MAWTSMGHRFSWERPKSRENPQDDIGPGHYALPTDFKPGEEVRPNYNGFNSTQADQASPQKVPPMGLDPGCYNPKFPKDYDHGLPKKHIPFTTGAPRSKSLKQDDRPGPGEYTTSKLGAPVFASKTMGVPQGTSARLFKSTSAPSIPRDHQCFGYEEAGDGRLVRQNRKDGIASLTGRPGDSAGPGQYDAHQYMSISNSLSSFGKIMPLAGDKPNLKAETPGPGYYAQKGALSENERLIYSSFASQTERGTKFEKLAAETPGPGAYSGPRPSRPNLREQHPELQYFGSTVERFKEGGKAPLGARQPGPGQYGIPSHKRRVAPKSSWSKGGRFEENALLQKSASKLPGPGAYDPGSSDGKTTGPTGTVSILGATGSLAFGSMEARRGETYAKKGEDRPGPGAYYEGVEEGPAIDISRSDDGTIVRKPSRKPRKPQSMFKSNVPKDAMIRQYEKDGQMGPPPGAYTPGCVQDIGSVMRMPPRNEGFGSAATRSFGDVKASTAPGPGWYKPGDITGGKVAGSFNRTAVEGAPASGQPKGLGFESQTKRFKERSSTKHFPGPGAYNVEPEWIKTTHNIHFGDFA
eukprot:TRINITY_DN37121_c0_g1_i1.p1 TRINITY_DN37121_c0_g1~~TRINITY_DN37121_c0_g1_i1.p1  ORF type:complete len:581 (-),score=74.19 TRINITY_DN37121_c0_g1_i1:89-1831(-)